MLDEDAPRRVVPRWRASWVTAQTPEGQSLRSGNAPNYQPSLERAKTEFGMEPSVPVASELMFIAEQAQNRELATQAAQTILDARSTIGSQSLLAAARRIVDNVGRPEHFSGSVETFIREARKSLKLNFSNPILLTDVAWAMTAEGNAPSAEKHINAALALAPASRVILRSAVRYFLHRGQKERAHQLLMRSPLLRGDPWIQASEIAVSTVLGRTSRLVKVADRQLQAQEVLPTDQTELSSAVATVHLNAGSDKKAKKLFVKSLGLPNDNVVAQAEWAARKLGLVVPEVALQVKYSFEANSAHSYRVLDMDSAIEHANYWRADEPFASRPLGWLAHLHAINDDFIRAAEFHQLLIASEPEHDTTDLLNQNFSRIETGAVDEAWIQLQSILRQSPAAAHWPQILANAGALAYATGEVEQGRELYERAAQAARSSRDPRAEALVRAFFARAAVKYGDPQAVEIVRETSTLQILSLNPSATFVVKRLVDEETRKKLATSAQKRVPKEKLTWDSVKNILTIRH